MASTEDRMRENRRVLAEITKSERTVIRLLHGMPEAAHELRNELDALASTAKEAREELDQGGCGLWLIGGIAGLVGGLVAGLVLWLLSGLPP